VAGGGGGDDVGMDQRPRTDADPLPPTAADPSARRRWPDVSDASLRHVVAQHLPTDGPVVVPDSVDLPLAQGRRHAADPATLPPGSATAVVLVDDELSRAGDHAEELIDTLGAALEPGGMLVATLRNRIHAEAAVEPLDGLRGWSADEAVALVAQRGFDVELLCAPGAAARLRGDDVFDVDADRRPGLLDAGPRLLLAARAPSSPEERGRIFLDSRPRKIAAAAVLCHDPAGRLLVVYDRFKRSWTIPGGVVDADEDPATAAEREAWEEAGTKVRTDRLLGVFASRWPDRLVFVFAATPVEPVEDPRPLHPHEIGAVAWLPLEQALDQLAPPVAFKVRSCLDRPGYTWVQ
jgi:8-oxo-dGTP pyrophosphatase MutT (NUDIX family)